MDSTLYATVEVGSSSFHSVYSPSAEEEVDEVIGGYLDDGKLCWIAKGPMLTIIHHGSKQRQAYKKFENSFNKSIPLKVVACKEYGNLLVVGLQADDKKGLICLFDPRGSKVIKTIGIPHPVSCLEMILLQGGATDSSKTFSQNLRWLFGVVAVGTEEGHLYLVDLRLDDKTVLREQIATIETVPTVVRELPKLRDGVHQRNAHLGFDLLDQCHENNKFHFVAPDDEIIDTFEREDVDVTSLHFERRCTSLFVGYSFGQFQIFDLHDMTLSFSSELPEESPIVRFVFQEPENDPKNFCYLWLVQSVGDEISNTSSLAGTMHQLMYRKKEVIEIRGQFVSHYSDLECCAPRFNIVFDPSLGSSPSSGTTKLLQCCAVEHSPSPGRVYHDDDCSSTPATSVLVVAWETMRNKKRTINQLLFDLNSWYVAHMPPTNRGYGEDEDYLALWVLNAVLDISPGDLMAFHTVPPSLHHFRSKIHPVPHRFTCPSAYSLKTNCLSSDATLTCSMPGVQLQIIQYMLHNHSECLVEPSHIFDEMSAVGLIDSSDNSVLTYDQMREYILSAALEHGVFSFLSRVISDFSSGQHAVSGCTLRFIMEWAWKTTAIIKDSVDELCVPIFDCSLVVLDAAAQSQLSRHTSELGDLFLVFKELMGEAKESSERSQLELDVKISVVRLIKDYLKILRWFIGAGLLPEQLEGHLSSELRAQEEFHFVYKQSTLRRIFETRRNELKRINTSSETSLLIIDGLIDDAGESLLDRWRKMDDHESASYPPPSLMALLDMYYLENIDEKLKHTIVTYFLLDILAIAESSDEEINDSDIYSASYEVHRQIISYFPQTFQLPPATTKLIKAFWMLDHKQFQDSASTFCEAGTERVCLPWQHRRILQAYMLQGYHDLSLQFLRTQRANRTCFEDVKLHIEVYVVNGLTHHALDLARAKADSRDSQAIFTHLLSCCYEHDVLHDLLKITVSRQENDLVAKYLQSTDIPHAHEMLILYHLRRFRYVQAIQLYRANKHSSIMTGDAEMRRHATLSHIIQGYINVLPKTQRELALSNQKVFEKNVHVRKEVLHSRPLSAVLNSRKKSAPLSHAALLSMTLNKPKDVVMSLPMTPFRQRPGQIFSPTSTQTVHTRSGRLFSDDIRGSESAHKYSRRSLSRLSHRSSLGGGRDSPSLLSNSQMASPLFIPNTLELREKRRSLMQSASVLLRTPPINRKRQTPKGGEQNFELMTPQSILKVKLFRGKSPSLPCISQTEESNLRPPLSETGSLTSLDKDDGGSRKPFNDTALDSSGSEYDIPAWMKSSAVMSTGNSVIKSQPAIDTRFTLDTPPVNELLKKFKGIGGKSLNKPATESQMPNTPKRLRFFGLNTSGDNDDEEEPSLLQLPPLDNIVVCQPTDENSDVNVTDDVDSVELLQGDKEKFASTEDQPVSSFVVEGDVIPTHDSDIDIGGDVTPARDDDVTILDDGVICSSSEPVHVGNDDVGHDDLIISTADVMRSESDIIEEQHVGISAPNDTIVKETVDLERKDLEDNPSEEEVVSRDTIVLRLSESSGDFVDAEEKTSGDEDVLEISSDEEAKTPQRREDNLHDYLQSFGWDTPPENEEERKNETPYQSFQDEDVPCGDPPRLPQEEPVQVIQQGIMQETNLCLEIESDATEEEIQPTSPIFLPQVYEPFSFDTHFTDGTSHSNTRSDENIPAVMEETCLGREIIQKEETSLPVNALVVEKAYSDEPRKEDVSSVETIVDPSLFFVEKTNEDKVTSIKEDRSQENFDAETKDIVAEQDSGDIRETDFWNELSLKKRQSSDNRNEEDNISKFTTTQEDANLNVVSMMEKPTSSETLCDVTFESVPPGVVSLEETSVRPEAGDSPQVTVEDKSVVQSGQKQSTEETEEILEKAKESFKTPSKAISSEPVFILSPPVTRSGRKGRRTPAKACIPPPTFVFSPPSSLRTRSQRKRRSEKNPTTKETSRQLEPHVYPPNLSTKPPLPKSARKSTRTPSRKPPTTPSRSSRRTKTKETSSEDDVTDHVSDSDVINAPKRSVRKTPSKRGGRQRKDSVPRNIGSESADADDEAPTGREKSSRRQVKTIAMETPTKSVSHTVEDSDENQPTVTRTSSRTRHLTSPVATRSSSRIKSKAAARASSEHASIEEKVLSTPSRRKLRTTSESDDQSTVTQSSSRRRNKVKSRDEAGDQLTSTIGLRKKESDEDNTKTPARKRARTSESRDSSADQSTVTSTSSKTRLRSRASSDTDHQPTVTRTSSRSRHHKAWSDNEQPVVTRSGSKKRNVIEPNHDGQLTATKTNPRTGRREVTQEELDNQSTSRRNTRKSKVEVSRSKIALSVPHRTRSTSADITTEAVTSFEAGFTMETVDETAEPVESLAEQSFFQLRGHDVIKKKWTPANEGINLVHIPSQSTSDSSSRIRTTASEPDVTRRSTRTGDVIYPIMSRRRAKIFTYDRKKKTFIGK